MLYFITGEIILLLALLIGQHSYDEFKNHSLNGALLACLCAAALFIATWPLWFFILIIGKFRASS